MAQISFWMQSKRRDVMN